MERVLKNHITCIRIAYLRAAGSGPLQLSYNDMHHFAASYEQTSFKPHIPGYLAGSRNVPHECSHCHITKASGAPAFPICSGCKLVRYCVSNLFRSILWYIYLIETHRAESIRFLTGKLTSRSASIRRPSTRTPWKACVPPPRWLPQASQ
jgi:hypothetical protein